MRLSQVAATAYTGATSGSLFICSGMSPASTSVPNPAKESTTACNQHVDSTAGMKLDGNITDRPPLPSNPGGSNAALSQSTDVSL